MTQSVLAETLRVLRARRGVGFVEAAEGMGVDRHTLRRLERGQGNPSYATLHKAAEYYGVTPQSLLVLVGEEGETEPPKASAPTLPQPVAEEPGEERRALYQSVAGALEIFCDEWEDRLDRGDRTPDTLEEFWQQSIGMVTILNPVWDAEWTQLRRERGETATMFDTTLYPSMNRFMALQDRYQQLLNEQTATGVSVPDEVAAMRERLQRAG